MTTSDNGTAKSEDRAPEPWTCWRCGPVEPHAIDATHPRGQGCGACSWTGVDLKRYVLSDIEAAAYERGRAQALAGQAAAL